MKNLKRLFLLSFAFVMMFACVPVFASELNENGEIVFSVTIDPNGGIPGKDYKSKIEVLADENIAVSGHNEDFLKAPEGKGFAGIEIILSDGTVETMMADSVLVWGDDYLNSIGEIF